MMYNLDQIGYIVKMLHKEAPTIPLERIALRVLQQQGYTEPLTLEECSKVLGKTKQAVSLNAISALQTLTKSI